MELDLTKFEKRVREFQVAFNSTHNTTPTLLPKEVVKLRVEMFDSEVAEFLNAYYSKDVVEQVDGLCDELFLLLGDYVSFGLNSKLTFKIESGVEESVKVFSVASLMLSENLLTTGDFEEIENIFNLRVEACMIRALKLFGSNAEELITTCLEAVCDSNMSKLGEDGKPIINGQNGVLDETRPLGKVLKGKNFFPPTEIIKNQLNKLSIKWE